GTNNKIIFNWDLRYINTVNKRSKFISIAFHPSKKILQNDMADKCIDACMSDYVALWNSKSINDLVEKYYRNTSKLLLPDGSTIQGKADIAKYLQDTVGKCAWKYTWKNDETLGAGDVTTSLGTYTLSDGTKRKTGRSVVVWKKGPDGCKIEVDSFNGEKCDTRGICH
uniref:DUF4440 domain-containing protein n=1 Tax=Romanomermis culicivorax TaxID=13658 RepID=A0A915IYE1_ROMCU